MSSLKRRAQEKKFFGTNFDEHRLMSGIVIENGSMNRLFS
jgi:hypothetical protein